VSYLWDTNVISELRKGTRANANVRAWAKSAEHDDHYLPAVVVGELRQGIEAIRGRDPKTARHLDRWFERIVETHADRILPIDRRIAELWGRLNTPDPLPIIDGLIAATAIAHDLTLVTRDVAAVRRTGVRLLNPFA
jgi:toxin FitB